MIVSKIRTKEDIRRCIDIYYEINDHSFVTINKEFAYQNLLGYVRAQKFLRILLDDSGEIIAWIYGQPGRNSHDPEMLMQQVYYASNKKGALAVRCVKILHEALVNEAKELGIHIVVSQGSHEDTSFTFARILEKEGWERRGYLAQLRIPRAGAERPPLVTFFTR